MNDQLDWHLHEQFSVGLPREVQNKDAHSQQLCVPLRTFLRLLGGSILPGFGASNRAIRDRGDWSQGAPKW